MPDSSLVNLIGELYEAASGEQDWIAVGKDLCALIGAGGATLSLRQGDGSIRNLLRPLDETEADYVDHYRSIDPIRAAASVIAPDPDRPLVLVEKELVPEAEYLRSTFYLDYARRVEQRYSLVSPFGDSDHTLLALFRSEKDVPFSDRERGLLSQLVPHMRRALQLQRRLALKGAAMEAGFAALEQSRTGCMIVDAGMRILFANQTGIRIVERAGAGLMTVRSGPRSDQAFSVLVARHRNDNAVLKALVADAAKKGAGGAMRVTAADGDDTDQLALLVSPAPARIAADSFGPSLPRVLEGLALVMLRNLGAPSLPPPSLFSDLFGLSAAEAAVAVSLLGGRTAEDVARARHVSLDTVRSQIRTVLRKSDAANLRDFERIGATLGSISG